MSEDIEALPGYGSEDESDRESVSYSDDEILPESNKRKTKTKTNKSTKKRRKNTFNINNYYDTGAVEDHEDDSDKESVAGEINDKELTLEAREAAARVDLRNERMAQMRDMSAEDIVRAKFGRKALGETVEEGEQDGQVDVDKEKQFPLAAVELDRTNSGLVKSSLLLDAKKTNIWSVRCIPGKESAMVRTVLLKLIIKGRYLSPTKSPLEIKSVFATSSRGYIFIEALAERYAKEAILEIKGIYMNSLSKIRTDDLTQLFEVSFKKVPIKANDWVRITRGVFKGDLARVVKLLQGGTRAWICAIPRPDYSGNFSNSGKGGSSLNRPPQQRFSVELAKASPLGNYDRKEIFKEYYDYFQDEYYMDGLLYKDVNIDTFITANNVNPRAEELRMFLVDFKDADSLMKGGDLGSKFDSLDEEDGDGDDDDDNDSNDEDAEDNGHFDVGSDEENEDSGAKKSKKSSSLSSGAKIEKKEASSKMKTNLQNLIAISAAISEDDTRYASGEMIEVIKGDLRGLIGSIISTNPQNQTVLIQCKDRRDPVEIEAKSIQRHISEGNHVKILKGEKCGQTGRVLNVGRNAEDDIVVVIMTDGTNEEVICHIEHCQVSDDVSTGVSNLHGYELYDLVALNENEAAIVIGIVYDKLRVLNHGDVVKEVSPQDILGKRNNISARTTAFDAQQHTIHVGDVVNVTSGLFNNRTGTIKHIMKGNIWVHSTNYLKNSGIFVVNGRQCVLAGATRQNLANNTNPEASLSKPSTAARRPAGGAGEGKAGHGKNVNVGKKVMITKGTFKGLMARISAATSSHYSVELMARNKKVSVPISDTRILEDKDIAVAPRSGLSSYAGFNSASMFGPGTDSLLTAETPRHFGSETPIHYGSETPVPAGTEDSLWGITTDDHEPISNRRVNEDDDIFGDFSSRSAVEPSPLPFSSPYSMGSNYSSTSPYPHSPASISSTSSKPAADIHFYAGVAVNVNQGPFSGRIAVVIDSNGELLSLQICDRSGSSRGERFQATKSDVSVILPDLHDKTIVIKGKSSGMKGVMTGINRADAIVLPVDSSEVVLLRRTQMALFLG